MRHTFTFALAALILVSGVADAASDVPVGRLPRTVVPDKVAVELKIDPAQARFSGSVQMAVTVAEATKTVWMHGRDLAISSARITAQKGATQTFTVEVADVSGVLKLTVPKAIPAGRAVIDIVYDAPFGELQGAYKVKPDGNDYVITQMEAIGARNTFPGFDEPGFKQPWDLSLVVPTGLVAVANTSEIRSEKAADGWTRHVFATTENLPSYLIAFAVGPWDVIDGPDMPANAVRNYPVKLRGIAAKGQGPRMKYALDNTAVIVAAEEAYFDIPYPFDKLDLVAAPDFGAGAMENAGLIVYRDSLMFADEKSDVRTRQGYWGTHAHELAHQWFGDLVTMPWWDDLWLNEAFATWMASKITGQLQPGFHSSRGLQEGALGAMGEDSLASTRRVHEPINEFTDIESAFDGITYQKGGATLAMFERYVGEEKFRSAIRTYLKKHARGNATSADLIAAIADVSDDPDGVRKAFASFIDQPGVPIVHVTAQCDVGKPTLQVDQSRYLPIGSTATQAGDWLVPLCLRYGDSAGLHEQCGLVGGKSASVVLKTDRCPDFVMPNADGAGYYRFAMSAADQRKLEANFDRLSEREQRAFADSIDAAFEAGVIDSKTFLSAAARLANAPVRQTATAAVGNIAWMIRNLTRTNAEKQALRDFVAKIYAPRLDRVGTQPRPGENDDERLLRNSLISTMASTAREPKLRAELAAKGRRVLGIGGDGALHLDAIATDQRGLALGIAMNEGDATVYDALAKHFAVAQDAVLRGQLLGAMGEAKDPALVARTRALAFEKGKLRRNELRYALAAGDREDPASQAAARAWLDANFSALEAKLSPGGASLVNGYAAGMCSVVDADSITPKFGQRLSAMEGGPRTLAQAVESVKLCASLKEKQQAAGLHLP